MRTEKDYKIVGKTAVRLWDGREGGEGGSDQR